VCLCACVCVCVCECVCVCVCVRVCAHSVWNEINYELIPRIDYHFTILMSQYSNYYSYQYIYIYIYI